MEASIDNVEQIAARLTEAQRKAILQAKRTEVSLSLKHVRFEWTLPVYRDCGVLVRSISDLGLTKKETTKLNGIGLAVRNHIKETTP